MRFFLWKIWILLICLNACPCYADQLPHTVAVLPFVNHTPRQEAGDIIRRCFYNQFSSLNYVDMELSTIDQLLKQGHLYSTLMAHGEAVSPKTLRRVLGTDAVIYGEVTDYGRLFAVLYSHIRVGLRIRFVNALTGEIVSTTQETVTLREGGASIEVLGVATTIARTVMNTREAVFLKATDQLCRSVVKKLPNPAQESAKSISAPSIRFVLHNGVARLLEPNMDLRVVIVGDAGQNSWAELPSCGIRIPLKEKGQGIYVGSYTVKKRDVCSEGRLKGYIQDMNKHTGMALDSLGPIAMATPKDLPSLISKTMRISSAGGPYRIRKVTVIGPGGHLIIGPGTEIRVDKGGAFVIQGNLEVCGSAHEPASFLPNGEVSWKGLLFVKDSGPSRLVGCRIEGAKTGIKARKCRLSVSKSRIRNNGWGIVADRAEVVLEHNYFAENRYSGIAIRSGTGSIEQNDIRYNGQSGILIHNTRPLIRHNNILGNKQAEICVEGILSNTPLDVSRNWWGFSGPEGPKLKGPLSYLPASKRPFIP